MCAATSTHRTQNEAAYSLDKSVLFASYPELARAPAWAKDPLAIIEICDCPEILDPILRSSRKYTPPNEDDASPEVDKLFVKACTCSRYEISRFLGSNYPLSINGVFGGFEAACRAGDLDLAAWIFDHFEVSAGLLADEDSNPLKTCLLADNHRAAAWLLEVIPELGPYQADHFDVVIGLLGDHRWDALGWLISNCEAVREQLLEYYELPAADLAGLLAFFDYPQTAAVIAAACGVAPSSFEGRFVRQPGEAETLRRLTFLLKDLRILQKSEQPVGLEFRGGMVYTHAEEIPGNPEKQPPRTPRTA